uniref:Uncharacterized protein n=1 Tax=Arundo donax TaxID=35708 RepID=A0A0A9AUZ1_ARUDO
MTRQRYPPLFGRRIPCLEQGVPALYFSSSSEDQI